MSSNLPTTIEPGNITTPSRLDYTSPEGGVARAVMQAIDIYESKTRSDISLDDLISGFMDVYQGDVIRKTVLNFIVNHSDVTYQTLQVLFFSSRQNGERTIILQALSDRFSNKPEIIKFIAENRGRCLPAEPLDEEFSNTN